MIRDSFFIKGQCHDVCQDYALHGFIDDMSYAMISDGCSTIVYDGVSYPHQVSDVASRLVCYSAENVLTHLSTQVGRPELSASFFDALGVQLKTCIRALGPYSSQFADATLSLLVVKDNLISELRVGDGILVVERNSTVDVYVTKFEPNYPSYCSHILDHRRANREVKCRTIKYTLLKETENWPIQSIETKNINNDLQLCSNIRVLDAQDVVSVSVLSDGLADMISHDLQRINIQEAVQEVLDIKRPVGSFVRRRLKAIVRGQKTGIGPNDDLSMAMIRIRHGNQNSHV